MSHIWYYCPGVLLFWSKIYNIYQKFTGLSAQPEDILRHMLTAACAVIARNQRKTVDPSIGEWVCEMSEMQSLELTIKTETGLREQTLSEEFKPLQYYLNI